MSRAKTARRSIPGRRKIDSHEGDEVESKQQVVVTDVRIPFWSMVTLMIKWAFASIPAAIVIAIIYFVIAAFFGGCMATMTG
jgi:hypothetical protein